MLILRITTLLLGSIMALSPPSAFAKGEQTVAEFKAMGRLIPQRLQKLRYEKIGRLDLSALLAKQAKVSVVATGFFRRKEEVHGLPTARSTAQWRKLPGGRAEIQVNEAMWDSAPKAAKAVIALHEYLGIFGFNDHDYVISSALWFLSLEDTQRVFTVEENRNFVQNVGARIVGGGSITGVGGGGDYSGVTTRMSLLKKTIKKMAGTTGATRTKYAKEIGAIFQLRAETSWVSPGKSDATWQSAPEEVADDANLLKACQMFTTQSAPEQKKLYRLMIELRPYLKKDLPNVKALLSLCRKSMANTDLDD